MKKIFLFILLIPFLSGCSYIELEDLAIASAIGIDYENNNFHLTAQIMDVKTGQTGTMEENALIYEGKGKTVSEAVRDFSIKYPKNIYFGHLEILVLSKDVMETHLNEVLDYFFKSPETRTSGYVLVNDEESARNTLNPKNEKENSFPAEDIKSILMDSTKRTGTVKDITLEEFTVDYLKKGCSPVLPIINIRDKKGITTSKIKLENMAVLVDKNKLIKLDTKSAIAYNTLKGNYTDISIRSIYKGKYLGPIIYHPKSKVELKLSHNKIDVNTKIKAEAIISNSNGIDQTSDKMHKKLEKNIANSLNTYIDSLINFCKENNADILGLKNMIYKNYKKEYKNYKDKNIYEIANFKKDTNIKIYRYGNTNNKGGNRK